MRIEIEREERNVEPRKTVVFEHSLRHGEEDHASEEVCIAPRQGGLGARTSYGNGSNVGRVRNFTRCTGYQEVIARALAQSAG